MPPSLSFTGNWGEVSWCHLQVQTPSVVLLERWLFRQMDSEVSPASAVHCLLLWNSFVYSRGTYWGRQFSLASCHLSSNKLPSYLTLLGLSFFICKTAGWSASQMVVSRTKRVNLYNPCLTQYMPFIEVPCCLCSFCNVTGSGQHWRGSSHAGHSRPSASSPSRRDHQGAS